MMTKQQAEYRRAPNNDKKRVCGLCTDFREGGTTNSCIRVTGPIARDHTCLLFEAKGTAPRRKESERERQLREAETIVLEEWGDQARRLLVTRAEEPHPEKRLSIMAHALCDAYWKGSE